MAYWPRQIVIVLRCLRLHIPTHAKLPFQDPSVYQISHAINWTWLVLKSSLLEKLILYFFQRDRAISFLEYLILGRLKYVKCIGKRFGNSGYLVFMLGNGFVRCISCIVFKTFLMCF